MTHARRPTSPSPLLPRSPTPEGGPLRRESPELTSYLPTPPPHPLGGPTDTSRLAALFDRAPAFICILRGPDHVFELANRRYYQLVGFRTVLGKPVREALPEMVEQGFVALLDRVLATGEPFVGEGLRVRFQRTPGAAAEERVINLVCKPITEPDGSRSGVFVHGVDVTAQVRAADALRESEARFRGLAEHSLAGTCIGQDGRIKYFNPKCAHIFGYSPQEARALPSMLALIAPEERERVQEAIHRRLQGECHQYTTVGLRKDGTRMALEVYGSSIQWNGRPATLATVLDVSERVRSEEALRAKTEALEHAVEGTSRLAGGVAHDFNNLLTVMKMSLGFLLEGLPPDHPLQPDVLELRDATDRATGLTRQLLAISRKQLLEPEVLDVNGCGTSPEVQARIVEPSSTTQAVGRGTGLSTVHGIVTQSNGHIRVESAVGRGTTVRAYLPQVQGEAAPTHTGAVEQGVPGGRETVLLVDDAESVRTLVRRMLTEEGYTVVEARDGREALRVARELPGRLDLVLTDAIMPEMGGVELVRALRQRQPDLRALYMSGDTDDELLRRGLLHQGASLLQKPFSGEVLVRRVRELLGAAECAA